MSEVYVLDTAALLSDWPHRHPDRPLITTPGVVAEVQNRPSRRRVSDLMSIGRLSVVEPDTRHLSDVRRVASNTGDAPVLSDTDLSVLAVALAERSSGRRVTMVSADTAVLNVARHLGLDIADLSGVMRDTVVWRYRCPACGHSEPRCPPNWECPVCGTRMRRSVRSRRPVSRR